MKLHLLLFAALLSITLYSCKKIDGCTDPNALNYNADATCDDGSCIAKVFGCMDSTAYSYNPLANVDDSSCIYAGCMDTASINYNPLATVDDGSCEYRGNAVFYIAANNPNITHGNATVTIDGVTIIINCLQCTDVTCGTPLCATFYDIPTQPGGQAIDYFVASSDYLANGTITIYPNVCTQREIGFE